jgi:hypothetical protein
MKAVTASPATGSPQGRPKATATRPASAPAEDSASSQECRASAISVAELIRLPTLSLYQATSWFPMMPSAAPGDARGDVGGVPVMDELTDALEPGEGGAGPYDHGDADPGQVLGALEPVGVLFRWRPPRQPEPEEDHGAGRDV